MSGPPSDLPPGTRLGEHAVERLLGRGGRSVVYLVRHASLRERTAAAKVTSDAGVERLRAEAAALARLEHPRIVRLLGLDLAHDPPYLLLAHAPGGSLRALLAAGPLAPARAVPLVLDVLEALAHAHGRGVVHGDLKPENVLLDAAGRATLTDFGGVLGARGADLASVDLACPDAGPLVTPAYAAPEVLSGQAPDARSDVYSAGVLLFEALAGDRPAPGDRLTARAPGASPALEEVFRGACCRREERFADAAELRTALQRAAPPVDSGAAAGRTSSAREALARLADEARGRVEAARREAEARVRGARDALDGPPA